MVKSLKKLFQPKMFVAGLLLAVASMFALTLNSNSVSASACPGKDDDTNAIVRCGFNDKAGFKADYNTNVTGDIDDVYKYFTFTSGDMDAIMGSRGVWGRAYSNGQIKLDDGRIVATNAWSIGRESFGKSTRHAFNIPGGKNPYYWSYLQHSFASGTSSIRVLVLMDKNNKYMEFAAMDSCGNPTTGDKPTFECRELKKNQIDDNTWDFWTDVALKNATVKNLRYEFSDGKVVNESDPNKKVRHDFAPGKHTVKVTVTYIVNGVEQSETLQIKCKTEVEVKEKVKVFKCDSLDKILIEGRKYRFIGKASFEHVSLTKAEFNFGDGQTAPGAIKSTGNTTADITAEHTYDSKLVGTKTITLDLTFTVGEDKKNVKCTQEVNFKEQPCIPKEGEDANCKILPKEVCVPKKGENADCKIPDTGPEAILGSALGLSSLAGAGMYYRASRKNLRSLRDMFKR